MPSAAIFTPPFYRYARRAGVDRWRAACGGSPHRPVRGELASIEKNSPSITNPAINPVTSILLPSCFLPSKAQFVCQTGSKKVSSVIWYS